MKGFKLSTLGLLAVLSGMAATPTVWAHGDGPIDTNIKVDHPIEAPETEFGRQGITREATRTIDISMSDMMRFTPDSLKVEQGETVRLRITNSGKIPHEFVLGTKPEITEHAEIMRKSPEMGHADANSARVASGKTSEIIWQFTKPGQFLYACLIPGHWEAGMQGTVTVVAAIKMAASDRYDQGVIRKVDTMQGKLTIKLGDIKNLDMPGMVMVFKIKDAVQLQNLKAGDAVQFVVEKQEGALVITDLKKAT